MKISTKAALFSGLLFPGIGHIYLRQYARGMLLALAAAGAFYIMVSTAFQAALEITAKIESGEIPLESQTIAALVARQSDAAGPAANIAALVLLISWIIGIVDSYRAGRRLEQSPDTAGDPGAD